MTQRQEKKSPRNPEPDSPLTPYTERMVMAEVDNIIKMLKLSPADKDDLAQEFRIALVKSYKRFNPSKASYSTFAARIVKDTKRNIIKRKNRGQEAFYRSFSSLDALLAMTPDDADESVEPAVPPEIEALNLCDDVRAVLKILSSEQRAICKMLMGGLSINAACKAVKISKPTYYEQVRPAIQKIFFEAGFDVFCEK